MPAGASSRREREFTKLEKAFKQEGRYRGREAEVAARIVNQQRAQAGETRAAQGGEAANATNARNAKNDAAGPQLEGDLPIDGYQHLTVARILARLDGLSAGQRKRLRAYEAAHKKRKRLLQVLGE
nr:hypothetical protein [uncultured Janthinobacterium sp.]